MKKILIVEDDTSLANTYKTAFEGQNFDVSQAASGPEAETLLSENTFDVILLDIILPKQSGLDILKKIRSDDTTKDIPVLMLTNYGQQEKIESAYSLGATEVLLKQRMTPQETIDRVNAVLKK